MIEKALIVIIFMYSVSFSVLAGQYLIGDILGITLKNYNGEEIKSSLLGVIKQPTINTVTTNIATKNYTVTGSENAFVKAASVLVELLMLLTGTYIFNMLYLLGVPPIIISGMVVIYVLLLARAIIGYIRGI